MKGYWVEGATLKALWSELPYGAEPFAALDWWEAMGVPWGAFVLQKGQKPVAAWPFAVRQVALFRLYRQPLGVPWLPVRLAEPLSDRPTARLHQIASLTAALAETLVHYPWTYVAGTLAPQWSYLPSLTQWGLRVRGSGSFVLLPGQLQPPAELRRKVRQAGELPFFTLPPQDAYSFWAAHRPVGVSGKFARPLKRLIESLPAQWRAWAIGHPGQAVALFLWGIERVWYIASARSPQAHSQAMTRLLYEVIQLSQAEGKTFDFCGSVLPTIERFFRQYGPSWEPRYFFSAWRLW